MGPVGFGKRIVAAYGNGDRSVGYRVQYFACAPSEFVRCADEVHQARPGERD